MFTESKIVDLYNQKIKLSPLYFKKYEELDYEHLDIKLKNWIHGKDYPRIPCILDFKEWINKYNITAKKLLYTCESDFELNYITFESKYLLKYEFNDPMGDLHIFSLKDKDYDFCLFSQTIEHLYNPFKAIQNIYEHLKIGGFVFTSVPTISIPHCTPIHYAGYYPMGLAILFESAGFEIVEMGQWGNEDYLHFLFSRHDWPDYKYLKSVGNNRIKNEEKNVAQCWCLAKKI